MDGREDGQWRRSANDSQIHRIVSPQMDWSVKTRGRWRELKIMGNPHIQNLSPRLMLAKKSPIYKVNPNPSIGRFMAPGLSGHNLPETVWPPERSSKLSGYDFRFCYRSTIPGKSDPLEN